MVVDATMTFGEQLRVKGVRKCDAFPPREFLHAPFTGAVAGESLLCRAVQRATENMPEEPPATLRGKLADRHAKFRRYLKKYK